MAGSLDEKLKAALDESRKALLELIEEYHEKEGLLFSQTISKACELALSRVNEKINQSQDEEIEKLKAAINKLNENQSNGSFLLDLVIGVIVGPLFGHLLEAGLKKMAPLIIRHREAVFLMSKQVDIVAGSASKWASVEYTPALTKQLKAVLIGSSDIAYSPVRLQKFFDYFTPFANDAAQVAGQSAIAALSKSDKLPKLSGTAKEIYKDKLAVKGLPISDLLEGVQDYVITQLNTNLSNKYTLRWLAQSHPEASFLDELSVEMQRKMTELPEFNDKPLKKNLSMLLEAVIWIYYLGKPEKWGSEKYSSGRYKHTYEVYQDPKDFSTDTSNVFGFQVTLPKSLFNYFLTRFIVPGTDQNYIDHFTKKKQDALKTPSGYGVDRRDEAAGWNFTNYVPNRYWQTKPEKAIDDPTSIDYNAYDMAGYELIRWFKELENALAQSEADFAVFLSGKGIKPVTSRRY